MRYYFDVYSGPHETVDEYGCELESEAEMRKEALRLLAGIVADEAPYGSPPVLSTRVRDITGRPVYRAAISVEGQHLQ